MDSSCHHHQNPVVGISSFPEDRLLLAPSSLSSQSRLVTSQAPASTGQVALGTGASHACVTMTPERDDSGALVSTGFRGKEGSVGPAVREEPVSPGNARCCHQQCSCAHTVALVHWAGRGVRGRGG